MKKVNNMIRMLQLKKENQAQDDIEKDQRQRLIDANLLIENSEKILIWIMEKQEAGEPVSLGDLHKKWLRIVATQPTAETHCRHCDRSKAVIEKFMKKICVGCAFLDGTNCKNKKCPCAIGQRYVIEKANEALEDEQKILTS